MTAFTIFMAGVVTVGVAQSIRLLATDGYGRVPTKGTTPLI